MPAAPQPNVIELGWNINWKTSSPGNSAPFFAPLYWKCNDVCFPRIHAYWIPHGPKLKSWLQNPTGWYENLPPFTTSGDTESLNMAMYPLELLSSSSSPVFSWEQLVFFHDSTSLSHPQKAEGQGEGGSLCWTSISNACSIDFPSASWKLHSI